MTRKVEVSKLLYVMILVLALPIAAAHSAVLHDNGPMVNSPGTHVGGGDESIMRATALGLTTYGFDVSHIVPDFLSSSFATADNFTIPVGTIWSIASVDFFAFQQNAATAGIFAAYLQIWNGKPGSGATVIWGDTVTNLGPTVAFTDTYVVLNTPGQDDDSRRVQKISIETDSLTLGAGTYWAAWSCDDYGLDPTRQFHPPIRIDNETTTGNAVVWGEIIGLLGLWVPALDENAGTGQDLPFIVHGEYCTDVDEDGYGEGTLCDGTDCNDGDGNVHALYTYYRDADSDGYGDEDTTTTLCGIMTPPAGYVDDSIGFDVDDTDPFYTNILPTCEVRVIPGALGWLIGDREKTRSLLVIGRRGVDFGENPVIKWESDAIEVVSKRVFAKRFMFMRATFSGEPLDKQEYRLLVNDCEGSITWAR